MLAATGVDGRFSSSMMVAWSKGTRAFTRVSGLHSSGSYRLRQDSKNTSGLKHIFYCGGNVQHTQPPAPLPYISPLPDSRPGSKSDTKMNLCSHKKKRTTHNMLNYMTYLMDVIMTVHNAFLVSGGDIIGKITIVVDKE